MAVPNSEIIQAYRQLRLDLSERGLFDISSHQLVLEVLVQSGLFLFSYYLWIYRPVPFAVQLGWLCIIINSIHLTWWIHDCGHDALIKSLPTAKAIIELLGVAFLGMPQISFNYDVHRRHHSAPNVIGIDTALNTGPIQWWQNSASQSFLRGQQFIWFILVLPLTELFLIYEALVVSFRKRRWGLLAFFAFRWWLFIVVLPFSLSFAVIPPLLAGALLGLVGSLNHFSMPIFKKTGPPVAHVFYSTQNLKLHHPFWTWLFGGLNYHIEHHLFPKMPSRHLAKAAPLVRAFAKDWNLPYNERSIDRSLIDLFQTLKSPRVPHDQI
jgi:fatty acid desaturase